MSPESDDRGRGLRSFLIGGVVGAVGALAAARRSRPRRGGRSSPAGLAAFEEAPCYRETLEREAAVELDDGSTDGGRSDPVAPR